jgi:hypothetical protein
MNLPRIGRATSIAASNYIGTTSRAQLTFQCQGISRNSSKNTNIKCPPNHNIAHCPYTLAPKQYGAEAQAPLPINISPKLTDEEIKEIQLILRTSGQHHGPHGPQLNRKRTNTRHHEHNGKGQTIVRLPCHTSKRDHSIPSVRHDLKRPLGRIVSLGNEGT